MSDRHQEIKKKYGLVRGLGLLEATAINMTNMVGMGPFITMPLIIAVMGGPQCMLGWLAGTILSICDGMVWSELATAMPGSGGSYLFLKESFKTTRLSSLLPFLFIWQFIISGPLEVGADLYRFCPVHCVFLSFLGAMAESSAKSEPRSAGDRAALPADPCDRQTHGFTVGGGSADGRIGHRDRLDSYSALRPRPGARLSARRLQLLNGICPGPWPGHAARDV